MAGINIIAMGRTKEPPMPDSEPVKSQRISGAVPPPGDGRIHSASPTRARKVAAPAALGTPYHREER